jgi:TRAP-type uncharacterized transport system substrate-binding protein
MTLFAFIIGCVTLIDQQSVFAQTKPKTKIKIAGSRVGDPWYIFSEALAYFLNQESEWLSATVVPTPGIAASAKLAMKKPKEYIWPQALASVIWFRKDPLGKAVNYYDGSRFIANSNTLTTAFVSYDPNIKTPKDMIGKKVDVNRQAATNTFDFKGIFKEWGVLDDISLTYSGIGGGVDLLKNGQVDIADVIVDLIYPDKFQKGSFVTDLETRKPIYYNLMRDRDTLVKLFETGEYATVPVRVPPRALDPKTQPEELWLFVNPVFFAADEKMDPDIVHEITRVIWKTAGQWATWHPQGEHMTHEFIPAMPLPLKYLHPGAAKFYNENNIKVTRLIDKLAGGK